MSYQVFAMTGPIGAILSDDRDHRYWLWRIWDRRAPILVVCMFNPSTADARKDDPTISRLCKIARAWGYGGILVVNLHSLRSPDPVTVQLANKLKPGRSWGDAQPDALGHALKIAAEQGTPILVAWGNLASEHDVAPFYQAAPDVDLICLGVTKSGAPKHPAARGRERVPNDVRPRPFVRAK